MAPRSTELEILPQVQDKQPLLDECKTMLAPIKKTGSLKNCREDLVQKRDKKTGLTLLLKEIKIRGLAEE